MEAIAVLTCMKKIYRISTVSRSPAQYRGHNLPFCLCCEVTATFDNQNLVQVDICSKSHCWILFF